MEIKNKNSYKMPQCFSMNNEYLLMLKNVQPFQNDYVEQPDTVVKLMHFPAELSWWNSHQGWLIKPAANSFWEGI